MNFEGNKNKIEQETRFSPNLEIGNFKEVKPIIVFCAISKKIENSWGNEQTEEIAETIKNNDILLNEDLFDSFYEIKRMANQNEETLKWLAFSSDKNASFQGLTASQIIKHKGLDGGQVELLQLEFNKFYDKIKSMVNLDRVEKFVVDDIKKRNERLPEIKKLINNAVNFFKPKSSQIKNVIYLPTNPLERKQSGYGMNFGENFYISSELGNDINEVHEFLHSIINPITEKIELSSDDEEKILKFCPIKLKDYQYPLSILTEEIIRTYKTGFTEENKPSFENFKKILLSKNKHELEKVLVEEKTKGELMSLSVDELLNSDELMKKYYEKYAQDMLSERIWNFFESYKCSGEDFENYLAKNYQDILN